MRPALFRIVLLSMFLTLAATGVASAHVAVSPEEVPAGSYEKLTVSVPTERDVPTTQVMLEAPEGFTVLGVQPVPGWDYEFEEDAGEIRAITWSGGEIAPREFQEFTIQTRTPGETGEFVWNAYWSGPARRTPKSRPRWSTSSRAGPKATSPEAAAPRHRSRAPKIAQRLCSPRSRLTVAWASVSWPWLWRWWRCCAEASSEGETGHVVVAGGLFRAVGRLAAPAVRSRPGPCQAGGDVS